MCSRSTCSQADKCWKGPIPPDVDPRTLKLCVCDPDADRLAALMAEGLDQRTASLMLWAPEQLEAS